MSTRRGALEVVRVLDPSALPRLLGWSAVAVAVGTALWTSPLSPVALWRADALLAAGEPLAAAGVYDAVAAQNPMPGVRARALDRSVATWALVLDVPGEALERLEALVRQPADARSRGDLLARLGDALLDDGRPAEAAVRFREARDIDPAHPEAGRRLAESARAAALAGDLPLADRTWARLARRHPEWLARAELGQGDVALREGRVADALRYYLAADDHTFDPDLAAVARLGAATCLERVGAVEQALLELDEAELPAAVHERRAGDLRSRGVQPEEGVP